MAAEHGDRSLHRQRWREERMRYEVLRMLYDACGGQEGCVVRVSAFVDRLGVWREELFRMVEFLDRKGFLTYHGAGPEVSLTRQGVDYMRERTDHRRSIRD